MFTRRWEEKEKNYRKEPQNMNVMDEIGNIVEYNRMGCTKV